MPHGRMMMTSSSVGVDHRGASNCRVMMPRKIEDTNKKARKTSGMRTKFLLESLRRQRQVLKEENHVLQQIVLSKLPPQVAKAILSECHHQPTSSEKTIASVAQLDAMMPTLTLEENPDANKHTQQRRALSA